MKTTHAPGPWAVTGKTIYSIDHAKRYAIARVGNDAFTPEANEANARLIAAAPALLENLGQLCELLESIGHDCTPAREAIAKATGVK